MTKPDQEWTAEIVREIGGHFSIREQRDKAIADAHNASLAAAVNELKNACHEVVLERKLSDRLAREREREIDLICELQRKLAAEKEVTQSWFIKSLKLEAQMQPLIVGLHRLFALRDVNCDEQARRAYEAALAQLEKKQ